MGLELPGWLTEPLGWIGLTWPEADEEKLFEAGQQWLSFGTRLADLAQTAEETAEQVWSKNEGDTVEAFHQWWTREDGPQPRLAEDVVAAEVIGAALIVFAAATLALKIAFIVQLVILAIEVAQAIASAFATFGATTAEVPGFVAATRAICRQLVKQVVEHVTTVIKDLLKKAKGLLKKVESKLAARAERRAARRVEESLARDLRRVNPRFDPRNPEFGNNCTHCVQAYELRRRGIDVQASGLPRPFWRSGGRPLGDIERAWGRQFSSGGRADIERAFAQPGSRGVVGIRWNNGGGHVFNVENVGGRVRFIDGQNAGADVSDYFSRGTGTRYLRLDDAPLGNVGRFVTAVLD